jgi:hypothetical protein
VALGAPHLHGKIAVSAQHLAIGSNCERRKIHPLSKIEAAKLIVGGSKAVQRK